MSRFIDFYREKNYIPTHQKEVDNRTSISRRIALYRDMCIPLNLLNGRKIIEFGPGGAYNARAILHFRPKSYHFVDAIQPEVAVLEQNVRYAKEQGVEIKVYQCRFDEFQLKSQYDLVVAEGCIPGQDNPAEMLKIISQHVAENGFLVITNISKTSILSEILRGVIGRWIKNQTETESEHTEKCVELFESHLRSLKALTRTPRDWVLDNVIHEWHFGKSDFSLPEALNVLQELGFSYTGGSPSFFRDFNW